MKLLLDTNILVDFLAKRPQFFNNAQIIIKKCKNEEITGVAAVHTISTLFYILKKYIPAENIHELFYSLFTIIEIGSANKESILQALRNKNFTDFEDGLQYQCALEEAVDCIITRNKKNFSGSKIPVYTPDVIAKKNRAVRYCKTVSEWSTAHKGKPWKHLFIPSMQISPSASFTYLAKTYTIEAVSADIYKTDPDYGVQIAVDR